MTIYYKDIEKSKLWSLVVPLKYTDTEEEYKVLQQKYQLSRFFITETILKVPVD